MHQAYLSLGSNIEPEVNLPKALDLLQSHGEIRRISRAWESQAVGSEGPNFLNACMLFATPLPDEELKEQVLHPIEAQLGRRRTADKFAPRTIDIDIVIFDGKLCNDKYLKQAFVVIPLAEIYPTYQNPLTQETIANTAARFRQQVWMEIRSEVLHPLSGYHSQS